jgi:hypothetical protein
MQSSERTTSGAFDGERKRPVVSVTVRKTAGYVATAFWNHLQPSPFHIKGSTKLLPFAKDLFQALDNINPAAKRQRAITHKLLRGMFRLAGILIYKTRDSPAAVIAKLAVVAFFFAMRSCECTATPTPGKTKTINLAGIVFRDRNKKIVPNDSPEIVEAKRTSFAFKDQKNNEKNDARPQRQTDDQVLCPVHRPSSLVSCGLSQITTAPPPSTPFLLVKLSLQCHKSS